MHTTIQTNTVPSNPYTAHPVPVAELQLLLAGAIVCFVVGMLLAEQTTLRRILGSIDEALQGTQSRATETI